MHQWLFASQIRSWTAFVLAMLLLALMAIAVAKQQFNHDLANVKTSSEHESELLASIITESLRRGQYQNVEQLLTTWGSANHLLAELTVTTQNGSVIGNYKSKSSPETTHVISQPIEYSYHGHATLRMARDLADIHKQAHTLLMQLLSLYLVLGTMLGFLIYLVLERQREATMLRQQTERLDQANNSLKVEITQRQVAEEALFEAKERAEITLHSIGDAVITTDDQGVVTYLNPVAEELTGWPLAEAQGKALPEVFNIIHEVTREPAENPVARCLREGAIVGLANHTVLISRTSSEWAIEDSAAPIRARDRKITGVVMVFHDVTQSRVLAKQLSWQASHDALTSLVNRREFEERLRRALSSCNSENVQHAIFYIDLDQFKIVNDTCGHVAGDELLRQLSSLLQRHMRASDTLSRLGGDEFGVLLEHCPMEQAERIADQLRNVVSDFRFSWDKKTFEVSASIGVAPIHRNSGTLSQILSAVDMACYVAKERGRNRYHIYEESDAEFVHHHGQMLWVTRLNQALREHHFVLYRQSIQSTRPPYEIDHYEVLLRIRNEDGTLSEPGSFLPAAERYDLMSAIDRWVIRQLFSTQASTLHDVNSIAPSTIAAINLSGASLNDDSFLDYVRAILIEYDINPRQICFEITETVAITHLDQAISFINTLRQLGCQFALDDFGSGLSSFGYLKNLPMDYLKIDGSMVRHIIDSTVDDAIVQAINEIGHVMGLKTIAEYVESDALRERLVTIGVDYIQGFAIEIPRPIIPTESSQ